MTLQSERIGSIGIITFNCPTSFNAITNTMIDALEQQKGALAVSDVEAMLLCGAWRALCAGSDLGEGMADALKRSGRRGSGFKTLAIEIISMPALIDRHTRPAY